MLSEKVEARKNRNQISFRNQTSNEEMKRRLIQYIFLAPLPSELSSCGF